jgi:hypothetical protein
MQSKRLSTRHVMLNLIGLGIPLQARVFTSPNPFIEPNHFEEELLGENGLLGDLLEDRTEKEVLPDDGGGLVRMSVVDHFLFHKLKRSAIRKKRH